jgi:hypothetical protein
MLEQHAREHQDRRHRGQAEHQPPILGGCQPVVDDVGEQDADGDGKLVKLTSSPRTRGEHDPADEQRRGCQHRGPAAHLVSDPPRGKGAEHRPDQQDAGQQFLVEGRQAVEVLADEQQPLRR